MKRVTSQFEKVMILEDQGGNVWEKARFLARSGYKGRGHTVGMNMVSVARSMDVASSPFSLFTW